MKYKSIGRYVIYTLIGFIVFAAGLLLTKYAIDAQGIMKNLPFIFIGIGAGVFGQNLGTALSIYAGKKEPELAKKKEIEVNDERNTAIRNKAKAKAYDLMIMVFGALMMSFALMQVDTEVVLVFVFAYLFIVFSNIYFVNKFNKEM